MPPAMPLRTYRTPMRADFLRAYGPASTLLSISPLMSSSARAKRASESIGRRASTRITLASRYRCRAIIHYMLP